jgi:hypothetical protein
MSVWQIDRNDVIVANKNAYKSAQEFWIERNII